MGQSHSAAGSDDGQQHHGDGSAGTARATRSKRLLQGVQEQRRSLVGPMRNNGAAGGGGAASFRKRSEAPSPPSPPSRVTSNQHTPEQSRELLEHILSTSLMPQGGMQEGEHGHDDDDDEAEQGRSLATTQEDHTANNDGLALPAVLISAPDQQYQSPPSNSAFNDTRVSVIPAQETIFEEPESEAPDSIRPGLLSLPVLLPAFSDDATRKGSAIPEHFADTSNVTSEAWQQQQQHHHLTVEATMTNAGDESIISHHSTGSFRARNSTDEGDRQALLAYWQQAGDTILQRRHSWASTPMDGADSPNRREQSNGSPYRSVPGRWTSSLDGRRGVPISFSDGPRKEEDDDVVQDAENADEALDVNASQTSSSAGVKRRRKPVPIWDSAEEGLKEEGESKDEGNAAVPISSLAAPKQYLLWPAKEEEGEPLTESRNKHNSQVSRASATTDALHSHVEALREGPRFVVDPSASGLLISTDSVMTGLGLGMGIGMAEAGPGPGAGAPAVGESPLTRPRKISLIARLKERVRRSSETAAASSPLAAASSPSKPSKVPSVPHTAMTPAMRLAADHKSKTKEEERSTPTAYPSGVRRNRKSALDASEAVIAARAARRRSQRSVHSVSSRSTRPSAKSVRARPSFGSTSRHTIRQQHLPSEGAKGKTRSHSQPVARNQHWWKQPLWPRKSRGTSSAAVRGSEWVDDGGQAEVGPSHSSSSKVRLGNASQPSLTGTELLMMESRDERNEIIADPATGNTSRDSPPLAYINSDNLLTPDPNDYHAFGYNSSSSDFSSLARARFPVPVPPPRPSRRGSKRSTNTGRESSSSPSPPFLEGEMRTPGKESTSSTLISPSKRKGAVPPSLPAIAAASPRSSQQMSDAGTAEMLLTDASGGRVEKTATLQDRLVGDEADNIAIMHPIRMLREQERAASQAGKEKQKERDDHGLDAEEDDSVEPRARQDSSLRGASMGVAADVGGEGAGSGPAKRPLPAPPLLAEPMTDLHSVVRTNSASSVHTASTFGGRRRLVSLVRYSGEEVGSGTLGRRSLPPTPNLSVRPLPSRSPVQGQRTLPSMLSNYETSLVSDLPTKPHSPTNSSALGRRSAGHLVRESWTSADGPWDARLVAISPDVKKLSPARGFAQPTRKEAAQPRQQGASSSSAAAALPDIEPEGDAERQTTPESERKEADRVPFAETAVQASLAALQALEQSEEGDDLRSRWAREKLMGSSNLSSTLAPSIMRMEPSMSELSSYSRSRRRAAPYPVMDKDGFVSSSAEEKRSRRKPSTSTSKARRRDNNNSSASLTEGQSMAIVFTSDSERARRGHGRSQRGGKGKKKPRNAPPLPKKEDWDEMVVPALAQRLRVEAEQEAEMASTSPRRCLPAATGMQRQESGAVDPSNSPDVGKEPIELARSASKKRYPEVRAGKQPPRTAATSEEEDDDDNNEADQRVKLARSLQPPRRHEDSKSRKGDGARDAHIIASISSQSKRTPKVRKGYGCDDIKAWQASLRVASAPIATLVE